jgi:hypothetical protein
VLPDDRLLTVLRTSPLLLPLLQGARIPPLPVVIGESGAKDWGDNSVNNTDTTLYTEADKLWLNIVASYLRALSDKTGRQPSWFWWAWNANSGAQCLALYVDAPLCIWVDIKLGGP